MYTVEEERELLLGLVRRGRSGRLGAPELPGLYPGDFSLPAHRLIWRALVELAYRRLGITPRAVAAQVARLGAGEEARQAVGILVMEAVGA
jgi:hypothetical protein